MMLSFVIERKRGDSKELHPREHVNLAALPHDGSADSVTINLSDKVSVLLQLTSDPLELGGLSTGCDLVWFFVIFVSRESINHS